MALWSCVNSFDCTADKIRDGWRAPLTYIVRTRHGLKGSTAQCLTAQLSSPGLRDFRESTSEDKHGGLFVYGVYK